jgi:hypothetical protein
MFGYEPDDWLNQRYWFDEWYFGGPAGTGLLVETST